MFDRREKVRAPFRAKLALQVMALFFVIFLIQLVLILWSYLSLYHSQEEAVVESNTQLLHQANENYLSRIVNQIDRSIIEIYYNELFWEDAPAEDNTAGYHALLSTVYRMNEAVESVYLYKQTEDNFYLLDQASLVDLPIYSDADNNFFYSGFRAPEQEWVTRAIEANGDMTISEITSLRRDAQGKRKQLLSICRALLNPLHPGELRAVLSVNIDMDFFDMLKQQLCAQGEGMAVLDSSGHMLYSGMQSDQAFPEELVQAAVQDGLERHELHLDGKGYLMLSYQAPKTKLRMVKLLPQDELFAEARHTLQSNLLSMSLVFLLSGLLVLYISMRIVRPINRLAEIMDGYKAPEEMPAMYTERHDEISRLYKSFARMTRHIKQLITKEYDAQLREKQARLETLQAQLNPHFLNNTLQTISGIAMDKGVEEIEQIVSSLSTILRYSLSKKRKLVNLREEITIVKQYMNIQKFRFGDRINLQIDLDPAVLSCCIPVLTLQLAVENAVRHGLETKMGNGFVRISCCRQKDDLELLIEDDGIGVSQEMLEQLRNSLENCTAPLEGWRGNGLINMHERIRGLWGSRYGLSIDNRAGGGFIVHMLIPCVFEESEDEDEPGFDH